MSKDYRGFSDDLEFYEVEDKKWKVKEVKGLKPKELSKVYTELAKQEESALTLTEQIAYNDKWDSWAKDVLETYLEFDYDKEVENYDITVLRKMGAEIFSFLMIAGTSRKEFERSKMQYMEMRKNSGKTKNSENPSS